MGIQKCQYEHSEVSLLSILLISFAVPLTLHVTSPLVLEVFLLSLENCIYTEIQIGEIIHGIGWNIVFKLTEY